MSNPDGVKWEPLPPRKKSKKVAGPAETESANRQNVKHHQDILDNIEQRSNVVKAISTLESKDGCVGENYEYLDHTADIQCHSWGPTLQSAFEAMVPCMTNYMTDITKVIIDPAETRHLKVKGHDLDSLLFNFMAETLSAFSSETFCVVKATITKFDLDNFSVEATLYGEYFDLAKHTCGTEIKAITYSNMQIHQKPEENRYDLFVIVDI